MAEQLAEAVDIFVQQRLYRLRSVVAGGETGTPGDQHHLHVFAGDPAADAGADLPEVVLDDGPLGQGVAGALQAVDQRLAGGIGIDVAGIAHREHRNAQGLEFAVGQVSHGSKLP